MGFRVRGAIIAVGADDDGYFTKQAVETAAAIDAQRLLTGHGAAYRVLLLLDVSQEQAKAAGKMLYERLDVLVGLKDR